MALSTDPRDTTPTSTQLAVTPPAGATAAALDKFVVRVCKEGSAAAADCKEADCALGGAIEPAAGGSGGSGAGAAGSLLRSICTVGDLAAGTAYEVTAAAVKGSERGLPSATVSFITPFRQAGGCRSLLAAAAQDSAQLAAGPARTPLHRTA